MCADRVTAPASLMHITAADVAVPQQAGCTDVANIPDERSCACFKLTSLSSALSSVHAQLAAAQGTFNAFHGSRLANWWVGRGKA